MAAEDAATEREIDNLVQFARLYGYVRFFHPSDEAAAVDWSKFAVLGAETVRDARDSAALSDSLRQLFGPIAQGLQISSVENQANNDLGVSAAADARVTFWQHQGVHLSERSNIYKSHRVIPGTENGDRAPLFQPVTPPPPLLAARVGPGLTIRMPLVLPVSDDGKTPAGKASEIEALHARLASVDDKKTFEERWPFRVGSVIVAWNVFQHFHPYLDQIGVKWDEVLLPALRRTLAARTQEDYDSAVSELVAHLQDGHGVFYFTGLQYGGLPIRVELIEGQIVVTGTSGESPFRKGDVVLRIDDVPAVDVQQQREHHVSGSPHLRRYRALNNFGRGTLDSVARVEVLRQGARETLEFRRAADRRSLFFNAIPEFEFPAIKEMRPGVFYVNLKSVDPPTFYRTLPELAAAKGVIFDQRWDGRKGPNPSLMPVPHIIPHLIDNVVQASPMLIPQVTQPDRVGWTFAESTWPVQPRAPRFKGRIVFINEPAVVSSGETAMAIIANYGLAKLVGSPTAGCNGNVNYVPLPDGLQIMWTGMEVLKHDRSPFYRTGFVPDHPVVRTMKALSEGRDEYLEKAIEVVEQAAH